LVIDSQKRSTASVFLRVRGNNTLPAQAVNAIRFLVANAVEGLQPNMVAVTDSNGSLLTDNNENDPIAGLSATQLTARKNTEHYLAKKVETLLMSVLGPGKAVAQVSAELNFDTQSSVVEKFDQDGQVPRTTTINDESIDSSSPNPNEGGAAGTQSNVNTETNTSTASAATVNHTKKKVTNTQFEIGKTTSNFTQSPGVIKRITAAVFVAQKYITTNGARVYQARPEAEIASLRKSVRNALGIAEADLQLEEIAFNDQPDPEIKLQLAQEERRQFWTSLAKSASYPVMALLIFGFFWRILKRTQESIPLGIPLGDPNRSMGPKEPVISVDALNQMIRENPTNMTQAIRGWMQGRQPK
jgi:flagellar M-ring protein FliF